MSLKFTGEFCVLIMENDAKFEEELNCQFKIDMRNLANFDSSTRKTSKIGTIKQNSPILILSSNILDFVQKKPIKLQIFEIECSVKICQIPHVSFERSEHSKKSKICAFNGILLNKVDNV